MAAQKARQSGGSSVKRSASSGGSDDQGAEPRQLFLARGQTLLRSCGMAWRRGEAVQDGGFELAG